MKRTKNVIFWAGLFIAILSTILIRPLSNLDEIWNFNMARGIANGLVPYKDINMIITPLLSFITAIFLKIFGTEMFVTRILAAILAFINLFLEYRILKKLKVNPVTAKIFILVIAFIFKDYFCLDYNFFVLTMGLIIILLELKFHDKNSTKHQILVGLFGGFAICTKQSIGLLICAVIVLNKLYFVRNRENVKQVCKQIIFRVVGIMIPIIIFVVYLIGTKSFSYFLDYCIYGIQTFSNKKSYLDLMRSQSLVGALSIVIPIVIFVTIAENILFKITKKEKSNFYTLTIYSLPIFAIVYPIADDIHLLIASMVTLVLLAYLMDVFIKFLSKKINKDASKYVAEFFHIVTTLSILFFTASVEINNMDLLSSLSKYKEVEHFKYIYIDNNLKKSIEEIDEYIVSQSKNVYILDSNSALYMIPIDRYTKDYDLFLIGNLGAGGENAQIEKIKNEDAKYLIMNDNYGLNWQNPITVRAYIKQNLVKSETIGIFDVYEHTKNNTNEEPEIKTNESSGDEDDTSSTEPDEKVVE